MPLTKKQKQERVADLKHHIDSAQSLVFMAYDKLTVDEAEELRDQLFEHQSRMRVFPKRLLKRVMEAAGIEFDPTQAAGQLALVWGNDAVAPAKTVHTFAKTREHIQIIGGVLEGEVLSAARVSALAELPSREQMLGMLVSVMSGPMRGLVTVMSGPSRGLVQVLTAIENQKK